MNMNSYETSQKFDLRSHSGLSNYRATLDQQMHVIVSSSQSDDIVWLKRLGHLLNNWFIVEEALLTPDSVKLADLFHKHNIRINTDVSNRT